MKLLLLITALAGYCYSYAQPSQLKPPLAAGKGRLVILFTVQSDNWRRPQERELIGSRTPVFLNGNQLCRMHYLTYSIHDVDTGNHEIATQFAGRKIDRKAAKTQITVTSDKTTYVEIFRDLQKGFLNFELMPISENLANDLLKKLMPMKNCKTNDTSKVVE